VLEKRDGDAWARAVAVAAGASVGTAVSVWVCVCLHWGVGVVLLSIAYVCVDVHTLHGIHASQIVATISLVLFNIPYAVLYFRRIAFFDRCVPS
jgi:hypothetical protein